MSSVNASVFHATLPMRRPSQMRRSFILGDPDEFPGGELTPAAALWRDEMVAAGGRVKELKTQLGNVHRREALHFEKRVHLGAALREVEDFDEMHTVLHRLLVNMRLEWGRYDTRTLCVEAHLLWCEAMLLASDWEENLAGMESLLSDYAQVVPADHPAVLMLRFWKAGYSVDWAEQVGGGSREIYLRTNLAAARDLHEVVVCGGSGRCRRKPCFTPANNLRKPCCTLRT